MMTWAAFGNSHLWAFLPSLLRMLRSRRVHAEIQGFVRIICLFFAELFEMAAMKEEKQDESDSDRNPIERFSMCSW